MSGFVQNTDLDCRLIFDNYSYFLPMTTGDLDTAPSVYKKLYSSGEFFRELGVTDFLFSPPFKTSDTDTYNDGYNIVDRYDVGEFNQYGMIRTKYGTKDELKNCIRYFNINGINSICNVNCNSVMFDQKVVVIASACDKYGDTSKITDSNYLNFPYYCNAAGGGLGQVKYGTFQKWNHLQFNGTEPQGYGLYRVMVDTKLVPYFYIPDNKSTSNENNTTSDPTVEKLTPANNIPSWINIDKGDVPQTVNGYFTIDGYYTKSDGTIIYYADVYSDPRNNVISQTWSSYKIENGATSNIEDWMEEQPGYSSTSEGTYEYFVFVISGTQIINVGDQTTYIKYPYDQNCISGEFYKGLDVNNTDSMVQSETMNWIKWINNLGFNGFMLEAADYYNYDLLLDIANFTNNLSGLQLVKTDDAADMMKFQKLYNSNSQIVYDSSQTINFTSLQKPIADSSYSPSSLTSVFINSVVWDQRVGADTTNSPNWSYVNNAETESKLLDNIPTSSKLTKSDIFTINKNKLQLLDEDRHKTTKQYAPYNEIICYAIILINSYTIPTIFYGDMWRSDATYLSTKTCYYQYISHLMKIRTRYAYGGQNIIFHTSTTSNSAGFDLISSTRFGVSSETGCVLVLSNNPNIEDTITIYVGSIHAGQTYRNVFSLYDETVVVNEDGYISILIVGVQAYYAYGHISVWVPVIDPSVYEGDV